ncbi:MAG TPA: alpha/beta hydrolase, partial [Ktedonobacterales bacterium]|nr:alpha/beta hydrolase [Ktedonobacterales bacterium]
MEDGMTIVRRFLDVGGPCLCCVDFGGSGSSVLLLHGLAGRGNEWRSTADWLTRRAHVFALDQRGHGISERTPGNYTRDAYVSDAIQVIERLGIAPVILIGQSMGGINAFLVAVHRPELVRALIVVEASARPNPAAVPGVQKWFASWPLPFPTLADARRFFGGETLYAQTWIEILQERPDGYWPQFDREDMLGSIEDLATHDYMDEWASIGCPTLVVGG